MDRTKAKAITESMRQALKQVAEQHGISIVVGGCSFSTNNVKVSVTAAEKTSDGIALTREAETFKMDAERYGLTPDDLGREFSGYQGRMFKIVGSSRKSKSYPIIVEDSDGKRYKFATSQVISFLSKQISE
jgi:hypothetical protein